MSGPEPRLEVLTVTVPGIPGREAAPDGANLALGHVFWLAEVRLGHVWNDVA